MGLWFRKSINLGGGFRINVSKSGIGYSWGFKGYRITKTAKGTIRRTVSIPGTGISFVDETRKKKYRSNSETPEVKNKQQHVEEINLGQSTEIINVDNYQPVEYKELLENIKKVQNINFIGIILMLTFILFIITMPIWTFMISIAPIFILIGIVGIVLNIYTHTKLSIPLEYEFDEESEQSYDNLCSIWMSMNENNRFWQTISEKVINKKVNGGASRGITRIPAKAINKNPYFIKSNIRPFGIQLRKQKLFFFPDKLLVVSGIKVGAINYSDMNLELGITNFVETEMVPNDAKVIYNTWLKVNKDGSPDKRFKNNRQVSVCEYGKVIIESGNTLYVELMCSNSATVDKMRIYAKRVFIK